jgi:hemerythrin-like metal-binding protein
MDDFPGTPPTPVGVDLLDRQHQRVYALLAQTMRALERDPEDPGAEERFKEVFLANVEHFKAEEDYLEGRGFPELIPHRFEHELLLDWFREALARRGGPHAQPLAAVVREAADLIRGHRETVDRVYAEWLEAQGRSIQPPPSTSSPS